MRSNAPNMRMAGPITSAAWPRLPPDAIPARTRGTAVPGDRPSALRFLTGRREIEARVGGADAGFGQAQLAAYDVGSLDHGHTFVIGDAARQTLAPEAAIGGDDEALGRDVFERLADEVCHMLGRLDHGVAVVDDPDAD